MKQKTLTASESEEQTALFQWADMMSAKFPELALMHHVPNGGQRTKQTAARLKGEGVKPGVPDICLPVPKGAYHGLFIEMKVGNNKPTSNQVWWLEQLNKKGYYTNVVYGWQAAADMITRYLGGPNDGN